MLDAEEFRTVKLAAHSVADAVNKRNMLAAYGIDIEEADAWAAWGQAEWTARERTMDREALEDGELPARRRRTHTVERRPPISAEERPIPPHREREAAGRLPVWLDGMTIVGRSVVDDEADVISD